MLLLLGWCLGACSSTECYYMDSITGDDSNSGTSPSRAWKTLDRLNQQVFKPGDKILFKSGTEYIGSFTPKGNGTEEGPIVVERFGNIRSVAILKAHILTAVILAVLFYHSLTQRASHIRQQR